MTAPDPEGAGGSDRGALETAMREAARTVEALEQQAAAARTSLDGAAAKVAEFGQWTAAAQHMVALHQEQERLVARALEEARRQSDELIAAAHAHAEDVVGAAKSAAEDILRSARATAGETVQEARAAAESERRAAEQTAAERLSRVRTESDQIVEEASRQVRSLRAAAEEYVAGVIGRLEALVRDGEDASRGLEALARNHGEALRILMRLRSETRSQLLPGVQRLLRTLNGEGHGENGTAGGPAPENAPPQSAVLAEAQTSASEHDGADDSAPLARRTGQIVISPIYSFLQATRFMTALSHTPGVVSVKVRAYSGAKATIEVVTEGHTVAGIDCKAIAGFPVDVVESSDARLVLRVGSLASRRPSG